MKILLQFAGLVALSFAARVQAAGTPLASVDLMSAREAALVQATWRYSDARVTATRFLAPGANGQPGTQANDTQIVEPSAGRAEFDDSAWPVIATESLGERRGTGRVSFNWYRIELTVPERIGGFDPHRHDRLVRDTPRRLRGNLGRRRNRPRVRPDPAARWSRAGTRPTALVAGARTCSPGQTDPARRVRHERPDLQRADQLHLLSMRRSSSSPPAPPGPVAVPPHEVNVTVERLDPAIDAIVPANAKLFKLAEGFRVHRRTGVGSRRQLPAVQRPEPQHHLPVHRRAASSRVFRDKSGYDAADIAEYGQPGSNGLTLDRAGRLTINEHGRHRVSRIERDGSVTVLAASYQGKRLNSPNDLVYRSDGSVYFTDPPFGLPKFDARPAQGAALQRRVPLAAERQGHAAAQESQGPERHRVLAGREVPLRGQLGPARQDGHALSPCSRDGSHRCGRRRSSISRNRFPAKKRSTGSRSTCAGNVYLSAPGGVWIFNSAGKHLGTITAPKPVHNFAWGGADGKTLYLCARSALYRIPLLVEGVRP